MLQLIDRKIKIFFYLFLFILLSTQINKHNNTNTNSVISIIEVTGLSEKNNIVVKFEGKLKNRSWEDENGIKKYATDIQGDNMTMLGSKRDSNPNQSGYIVPEENTSNTNPTNTESIETNNESSVDDLPFSN